jgi:Leucine-rich repeat (LRR) protein
MLKILNLSFNDITYIKRASFNSLHTLEFLDISHSKTAATETDAFQNLPRLAKLILVYNEIINVQPLSF